MELYRIPAEELEIARSLFRDMVVRTPPRQQVRLLRRLQQEVLRPRAPARPEAIC